MQKSMGLFVLVSNIFLFSYSKGMLFSKQMPISTHFHTTYKNRPPSLVLIVASIS